MKINRLLWFLVYFFACADPFETNSSQLSGPRVLSAYYDGGRGAVQLWDGSPYFDQAPSVEWWSSGQMISEGPMLFASVELPLTVRAELDGEVLESIIHDPTVSETISASLHVSVSDVLAEPAIDDVNLLDFIGERVESGVNKEVLIARIPETTAPLWSNWGFQSSAGSVVPYSHHLAVLSRKQLDIDEGVLSVGTSTSAIWGAMYVSQQNMTLDLGWLDVLWEDLPSDRKAVWHQGRLFSVPAENDLSEDYEGLLGATVTFDERLPHLDNIELLDDIADTQALPLTCSSPNNTEVSAILDWQLMSLGVCTLNDLDGQRIFLKWGHQ